MSSESTVLFQSHIKLLNKSAFYDLKHIPRIMALCRLSANPPTADWIPYSYTPFWKLHPTRACSPFHEPNCRLMVAKSSVPFKSSRLMPFASYTSNLSPRCNGVCPYLYQILQISSPICFPTKWHCTTNFLFPTCHSKVHSTLSVPRGFSCESW